MLCIKMYLPKFVLHKYIMKEGGGIWVLTSEYVFNTTNNSVMGLIYYGVKSGLLPTLIFLGIGAMTDFSALLARPKSVLLGAAAQVGIFITFLSAIKLGFSPENAAAIGIIGGADGPTAIFLSSKTTNCV